MKAYNPFCRNCMYIALKTSLPLTMTNPSEWVSIKEGDSCRKRFTWVKKRLKTYEQINNWALLLHHLAKSNLHWKIEGSMGLKAYRCLKKKTGICFNTRGRLQASSRRPQKYNNWWGPTRIRKATSVTVCTKSCSQELGKNSKNECNSLLSESYKCAIKYAAEENCLRLSNIRKN